MSQSLIQRLFTEINDLSLVDPHTHINPLAPASATLADILGYHYYTELAHSAGTPRQFIEEAGIEPAEKVRRIVAGLAPIENTVQYSWLIEMCQRFFGFTGDRLTLQNWESLYAASLDKMRSADWANQVLRQSRLSAVFLTNDFDDPLSGFDTSVYIPCLRTDDLVFHISKVAVRERLQRAAGGAVVDSATLRSAIGKLFDHFVSHGARACAISLPPDFAPRRVTGAVVESALSQVLRSGDDATPEQRLLLANHVFWTLAEFCAEHQLPFDLMIGVNRAVYSAGVHQGQDLFDSRVSLIQYRDLFNAFPQVTFPISVLASVTNQELVAYSWIFPNVVANGHWWYSNTPEFIERDCAARLEAVPQTKQIGYYSDMYKLEFGLPKFAMYKRILAKVLAERFVIDREWSEERALQLARTMLCDNVQRIFPDRTAR
ncbi:MAG: glucuronate isomerase [Pirellulales bacterium]|nr:glucuronate isomerase [Pirellulales bacterium]